MEWNVGVVLMTGGYCCNDGASFESQNPLLIGWRLLLYKVDLNIVF